RCHRIYRKLARDPLAIALSEPTTRGHITARLVRKREVMNSQVTLTLPEEVLQRATLWAGRVGRPVNELLAEAIELSLMPLGASAAEAKPITSWSDADILAAVEAELAPEDDRRLSELLHRQQAGTLTATERAELQALMQLYQAGLLRKATALREAVQRG